MTDNESEQSERDWSAAHGTILMLGNVDMFYCPDLVYTDDLYQYVITKVRRRLHYYMGKLDKDSAVAPILDQMLGLCTNFQAALHNARFPDPQADEVEPSQREVTELATAFLDKMSAPITRLVKDYNLYVHNRCLAEMMVRPDHNSIPTPVFMV